MPYTHILIFLSVTTLVVANMTKDRIIGRDRTIIEPETRTALASPTPESTCPKSYIVSYYTDSEESKNIVKNIDLLYSLFYKCEESCIKQNYCPWYVEIKENGEILYNCTVRE